MDFMAFGSSLSLRGMFRSGSAMSILGKTFIQSRLSVIDVKSMGSALSVRQFVRLGSQFSALNAASFGSSLSVRSFSKLADSCSLYGKVLGGSSLSVRGFARMAGNLSMRDVANTYSHLLVGHTIIKSTRDAGNSRQNLEVYPGKEMGNSKAAMTMHVNDSDAAGGILHGTWTTENAISSSDRRLKVGIAPLYKNLLAKSGRSLNGRASVVTDGVDLPKEEQTLTLIRELRPVSFKYKKNAESKFSQFGFIAQEIEKILPDLVLERDGTKFVQYNDLIAVITLGLQSVDMRMARMDEKLRRLNVDIDADYDDLSSRIIGIEEAIKKVIAEKSVKVMDGDQEVSVPDVPTIAANATATVILHSDTLVPEGADEVVVPLGGRNSTSSVEDALVA
jgi:hypothetical protein